MEEQIAFLGSGYVSVFLSAEEIPVQTWNPPNGLVDGAALGKDTLVPKMQGHVRKILEVGRSKVEVVQVPGLFQKEVC